MKAIRVEQTGGPDVLQLQDVPRPEAGDNQALVKVHAAGLNFVEVYHRRGSAPPPGGLPFIVGQEGSGVVEALGPGAEGVKVGDRVAWAGVTGSYAEYVAAPTDRLIPLSDGVDFIQGAALALQGMTAHYLLHSAHHTQPGEVVLVHAAAGGVGQLAVQIAKLRGARVIGTVSSEAKARHAREAGADEVIDYTKSDFAAEAKRLTDGQGVDLVLDAVGKTTFLKSLEALRVRGHLVVYGQASGPPDPFPPLQLQRDGAKTITGTSLIFFTRTREEMLERANAVFGWLREGKLKVQIGGVYPLAQASEAQRALESRETTGKLVLTIG